MAKSRFVSVSVSVSVLLVLFAAAPGWTILAPPPDGVGPPVEPHGFPAYYSDPAGLALEPCLPPPAGKATRLDLCLFDPVNPNNPASVALGVGSESFWWMADARAPALPGVTTGKTLLVLALEGAFTAETPDDGQQMTFGRVRIRVDVPTPGTYTVTHPFGTHVFENVTVADGINHTEDIGGINILNPPLGYEGALASALGPFLTWPGYEQDVTLQVLELDPVTQLPTGVVREQYVGDPNIPHTVVGGPNGNVFRVEGPGGIVAETDLFSVMGKVYDGVLGQERVFPPAPQPKLFAVGPVNRAAPFAGTTAGTLTGTDFNYPVGFPLWYQENAGTAETPAGGLKLTLCPPTDPMCISAPINPGDPESVALRTGDEAFWWSAEAQAPLLPGVTKGKSLLVLALEAAFAVEVPRDGDQIGFGRLRIRVDVPIDGTYTITHPYGTEVLENVTVADGINMTRDVMMIDLADPDGAFGGALFSDLGPTFLTWDTFPDDPALQRLGVQYVGDPAIAHRVKGSPTGGNLFRIQGPFFDGAPIDVQTDLFTVTGKVFDEATFQTIVDPDAPLARADAATLDLAQVPSVAVAVLANDTKNGIVIAPAQVANLTILPAGEAFGPVAGAAVAVSGTEITYTPPVGFAGVDTFAYQITDTSGLTSAYAVVTVTVLPAQPVTVQRARLDLRRLGWDVRGVSSFEGAALTIHAGPTAGGPVIGTATVSGGRWSFRGTALSDPNVDTITVVPALGGAPVSQTLQIR